MSAADVVTATVEVALDPAAAFQVFTEEIGQWWRPGPINWYDARRAVGTRIEPGVGGRWLEIYDEGAGDVLEIARVRVWEPGVRLVLLYRDGGHELDGTEIEVRFEAIDGGTRVTLEHRGWDTVSPDIAARKRALKRSGWAHILGWFQEWAFWGTLRRVDGSQRKQKAVRGYLVGPGEGVSAADSGVKASRVSTGGAVTLIESHTRGGAPMHVHHRDDECFYVLEGTITVRCGEEELEAGPRSFVFLPRGTPHGWDVVGDGTATVLLINVPAGLEEFLREYHAAGSASNDVKDQIAAKYGIEWVRGPES
jgi:mannose-6-phosphate isomerase-like protein (cupin superfamily)